MKTTYKVIAITGFGPYAKGEEFEAELTPEQEKRAKQRGSIRAVKKKEEKNG